MRKKIRIKVKYLIIIPIVIFIILPNILYFAGRSLFIWNKPVGRNEITTRVYSYGILNLYTKWPKVLSPFEGMAYYSMGVTKYDYKGKYITNGKRDVVGYIPVQFGTYEEGMELYKKGLKESNNSASYSLNVTALFNMYMNRGEIENAKKIMKESLNRENFKENSAGKILEIQLAIIENDIERARKYYKEVEKVVSIQGIEKILDEKKEDYYYTDREKKIGEKIEIFNERSLLTGLGNSINMIQVEPVYEIEENEDGTQSRIFIKGDSKVRGRITIEGKPMGNIPVIVGNVLFSGYYFQEISNQIWGEVVYTDKDGYYEVDNIPSMDKLNVSPIIDIEIAREYIEAEKDIQKVEKGKEYELNLDLKKRMNINIDKNLKLEGNSFEINFDKVEGADYYSVELMFIENGGGYAEYFETEKNKVKIPLLEGSFTLFRRTVKRKKIVEGDISEDENESKKTLQTVSELNYSGRYKEDTIKAISVRAIKRNGDNEYTLNSQRIETNIKSKNYEVTKGAKLLDEEKYEEGEIWLKEKIEKEGYKREYIYPLIWINLRDGFYEEDRDKFYTKERLIKTKKEEKILLKELYKINENKDEIRYFENKFKDFYMYGYREGSLGE